jgi:hypothetical protein
MALTKVDDRGLNTPIDLLDNENIRLGTGNDLKLYHDGTESVILSETGGLQIKDTGGYMRIRSDELKIQSESNETYIEADANGSVQLFYDNSKKLETTSSGVTVTGTLEATTYVAVPDQIYHVGDADTTIRFPAADTIALETAGSERMRIDSSGNVGIGTTSPSQKLHVDGASSNTFLHLTNGTTGSASGDGSRIGIAASDSGLRIQNQENSWIRFETNGSERMRILSGGGITFNGDTATANALDDYEQGTFTASLGSSGGGASFNSGQTATGYYVKVGSNVSVQIYFSGANIASAGSGVCVISGLPFTSNASSYYTLAITHNTMTTGTLENGYVQYGNTIFYPIVQNGTGGSPLSAGNPRYMMIGGWYPTAF